ncbi:gas vesicle protein [Alphaproteobacteria bacterium GH1-50]|uniref:Gas vesicle protein n=1 Tax=Kangsaoukella pontilimi TaxID=2691042 RepID=A0A7C9MVV6_9RHOB|nr:GvpL/GvpF family gas vesicle protein [Kangsaoukella pontilimi]MXQ07940.1 gas vesicle protein [Kangsaoukella pontilimi]
MIYLYGLLEPGDAEAGRIVLTDVAGVTGAVSVSACGGLALIYGPHDGEDILPRRRLLLAHAKVLELAMQAGPVLPMRFGMSSPSLDEVERLVIQSRDAVREAFDRVRGHVEIGVRVSTSEEDALKAAISASPQLAAAHARLSDGQADHFAKVDFGRALGEQVGRRRQAAQKRLLTELKPFVASHVLKAPETDFEVLRAEFLIAEDSLDSFTSALEAAASGLEFGNGTDGAAQIVGPGPAFHFVNISLAGEAAGKAA